ncbi:hypothetical protein CHS0354_002272 [Potamilus streckersoni]|uniref:Uncharacterized protein n=1 Tax=Potamilus streckersoni TaxID=2493646 RepID=A0AAE0S3I7_9BIVA|nr:hypothetical protein CHS0354_002272 [Potamilus streckersoni]
MLMCHQQWKHLSECALQKYVLHICIKCQINYIKFNGCVITFVITWDRSFQTCMRKTDGQQSPVKWSAEMLNSAEIKTGSSMTLSKLILKYDLCSCISRTKDIN